ncbi:alpha/beta hydrolase [Corynebacterium auriscanis]|uniref:alpha/beta hydrolase n=1 Tax=Corynebacterium auriscanis TaxID=99807 RepID=UPI003CE87608
MHAILDLPLTDFTASVVITILSVIAIIAATWGFRGHSLGRSIFRPAVLALGIAYFGKLVFENQWGVIPDKVPWELTLAVAGTIFVVLCAFMQRRRRVVVSLLVVFSVLTTVMQFNAFYQTFPDLQTLEARSVAAQMDYREFQKQDRVPKVKGREAGALVEVALNGGESGWNPRASYAYLPPAYWTREEPLPVLLLMAGNPGTPDEWIDSGRAVMIADAYQRAHDGVSPIVMTVDATGSFTGNPGCTDGPRGNVMRYLTQDLPRIIGEKFTVNPDRSTWTIGGLSYGGTCALQVVTNHPEVYGNFLDFSGEPEMSIGSREATIGQIFGGDADAFWAQDPQAQLRAAMRTRDPKYRDIHGIFAVGVDDKSVRPLMEPISRLANNAGMHTRIHVVPGGHDYQVWRVALAQTFEWVAQQGKLGPHAEDAKVVGTNRDALDGKPHEDALPSEDQR